MCVAVHKVNEEETEANAPLVLVVRHRLLSDELD